MTDDATVEVRRSGRRLEAQAVLYLPADAHTVWDTITDYDALPQFMPGIRACRVIERRAIDVFEGRHELKPLSARRGRPRTQLRYPAPIGLQLPPAPAVGSVAVRQNLAAQLEAVAREVVRRSGDAARKPGSRR